MRILTLVYLIVSCSIYAQDGVLDLAFGNNGIVRMDLNNSNDVPNAIKVQPDGKILVAGYTSDGSMDNICLARFNNDGTPDTGFGSNGTVITQLAYSSMASDIQIQADGKICVAGHTWSGTENEFMVARYHSNGTLDSGFGSSGIVTTTFPGKNTVARALQIQSDGKMVLVGRAYTLNNDLDEFAVARYTPNGVPDVTFGTNGWVLTSLQPNSINGATCIQLDADEKIVVGGFSNWKMGVVRYNSNGDQDQSFGQNGVVLADPENSGNAIIYDLAISEDGSILGGGFSVDTFSNFTLVKFTHQGIPDNTFGQNGMSITPLSSFQDGISAIELLPDNRILASGMIVDTSVFKFALARFDETGALDPAFGNAGFVSLAIDAAFNYNTAMAVQGDGKIVTIGYVGDHPYDFGIVRYHSTLLTVDKHPSGANRSIVYPNPSNGLIHIQFLDDFGQVNINLFNVFGELIYQNQTMHTSSGKSERLYLENLSDGIYILQLGADKYLETHQIVISGRP